MWCMKSLKKTMKIMTPYTVMRATPGMTSRMVPSMTSEELDLPTKWGDVRKECVKSEKLSYLSQFDSYLILNEAIAR